MLSLYLLFEGNLGIIGERIVVGAFVVIPVNTMMMAQFGVMMSTVADTEVSQLMCVELTHVCCQEW